MTTLFDEVKNRVSIKDLCAAYGIHIKHNKAVCIFHKENSASFTIYPATNSWYCFGCGRGGSVVDFVAVYHGIEPLAAAKELDMDFNLGLSVQNLTTAQKKQAHEARKRREHDRRILDSFDKWERRACIIVADYLALMREWELVHAPKITDGAWHPLFVEAQHNLDLWNWLYETVFIGDDFEIKLEFYRNWNGKVRAIEQRLNNGNKGEYVA